MATLDPARFRNHFRIDFRIDFGRLLKPLGCLLGASWDSSWAAWGHLGRSWEALGRSRGASWGVLGPSWEHFGPSWRFTEAQKQPRTAPERPRAAQDCQHTAPRSKTAHRGPSASRPIINRIYRRKITLTKQAACPHRAPTSIDMIRATRGQVDR